MACITGSVSQYAREDEDRSLPTLSAKSDGCREPSDSCSDDCDVQRLAGHDEEVKVFADGKEGEEGREGQAD